MGIFTFIELHNDINTEVFVTRLIVIMGCGVAISLSLIAYVVFQRISLNTMDNKKKLMCKVLARLDEPDVRHKVLHSEEFRKLVK